MVFIIGLFHSFATRNAINPDGISYLDIGDAYFRGDFNNAINAYWSPLFSIVQGLFLYLIKPSIYEESSVVHFTNFLIFLFTYGCFYFFLEELIKVVNQQENKDKKLLPDWIFLIFGNVLFLWTSTNLITISLLTPDLLVSGIVYLIVGLLLNIKAINVSVSKCILLGFVLGIGYLSKTFLFPLALVIIFIFAVLIGKEKHFLFKSFLVFTIFAIVSAPFIYLISKKEGSFTFGQSGKFNFAWYMNDSYEFWRGGWAGNEELIHPSRKIYDTPRIYEFATPIKGTYPFWYDPAYWFKGLKPHFNLKGELDTICWCLSRFFKMYVEMQSVLVFLFIFLYLGSANKKVIVDTNNWFLILIPLIVYLAYLLVATEIRYLGAFNVLLWLGLLMGLRFSDMEISQISVITIVVYLFFGSILSTDMLINGRNDSALTQIKVAQALKDVGVNPGDKAAATGLSYGLYWARLAKISLVAEVSSEANSGEEGVFWFAEKKVRDEIFNEFRKIGIKVVVSEKGPDKQISEGWIRIKDTSYHYYLL